MTIVMRRNFEDCQSLRGQAGWALLEKVERSLAEFNEGLAVKPPRDQGQQQVKRWRSGVQSCSEPY